MNTATAIVTHLLENEKPDARTFISQHSAPTPAKAYSMAFRSGKARPDLEHIIARDGEWSYVYARYVLKSRFPLGEPAIARSLARVIYNRKFGTDLQ